jgi:hypothetical protein
MLYEWGVQNKPKDIYLLFTTHGLYPNDWLSVVYALPKTKSKVMHTILLHQMSLRSTELRDKTVVRHFELAVIYELEEECI